MFKSSENLRLAAEMRALERVAAPWREARTTWFDGTPDSIAARLAATERVLTHARAGYTGAHVTLEREASTARTELLAAQHRLMTDFLDDGARAFKGSKRVAEGTPMVHPDISFTNTMQWPRDKEDNRFTLQRFRDVGPDETVEQRRQNPSVGVFNHDASEMLTNDGAHHWASRRVTADETTGFAWQSDNPFDDDDPYFQDEDFRRDADDLHALEHKLRHGPHDDDDPARYSRRRTAGDGPGPGGIDDMMFPRDRQPTGADYLAEMEPEDRPGYGEGGSGRCKHCEETITEKGMGYAHYDGHNRIGEPHYYESDHDAEPEDDEDYHTASRRTAATLPDFDDQLLFDS
jgi:hypothetical protein